MTYWRFPVASDAVNPSHAGHHVHVEGRQPNPNDRVIV